MKLMENIARKILLNPGPATTADTVKMAQVVPDICPREEEFIEVMREIRDELTKIAGGLLDTHTTILFGGSGTAVMDAAINSAVPPGKAVAVVVNGAYGQRLADIARAYQISVREIKGDWYQPISVETVKEVVADPDVGALAFVHHETTTGLLNPLEELTRIGKEAGCTVIVDAISSFAGIPINLSNIPVDFLLSTSNKCIQGMAGLGFVIAQRDAMEKIKSYSPRSYYLNLWQQYENFERTGETRFTPPVQVAYALRQAIKELEEEGGVVARHRRYLKNYDALRHGLTKMGFEFVIAPVNESGILMTVKEPSDPSFNFTALHDRLLECGFTIYPGKLTQEKTFRLAIMGDIQGSDIENFLSALENILQVARVPV